MSIIMNVGLDVSMNSTGVVINIDGRITKHKIISEMKDRHSSDCIIHSYDRIFSNPNYSVENICKIISAEKLSNKIRDIVLSAFGDSAASKISVRMEGSAMGSFGNKSRGDDLTNFSSLVKRKLISIKQVESISIVPPTSLKKFATGNGGCKKDLILLKFYELFPDFDQTGKNDDVADAYFLSVMDENDIGSKWCRGDFENIYKNQITSKYTTKKPTKPKKVKKATKTTKPKKVSTEKAK